MWLKPRNIIFMIISSPVFRDITEQEVQEFVSMNAMQQRLFGRGEIIIHSGERTEKIGIVLSGSILIENNDPWGNCSILSNMGEGNVFAESYVLSREPLMVDVVANEESDILFVNLGKLMDERYRERSWYIKLLKNLVAVTAGKNMVLSNRIFCTTPKTIRARLLTYLSGLYAKTGERTFSVPFNREQMASYLNTDRTALSKELGRMKRDGLIDWHKNSFTLLIDPE